GRGTGNARLGPCAPRRPGLARRALGALRPAPPRRRADPGPGRGCRRARPAHRADPRGRLVSPFALFGARQRYDWGSRTALPALLGEDADAEPWAEQWFGAHSLAPSALQTGESLDQLIAAAPAAMLGEDVARAFGGRLPFLLKLIAAERPLSLQVHPTREHAEESFAAETAAGLPLDSPRRSYRDANHKPEM